MLTPLSNAAASTFAETSHFNLLVKPYMNSFEPPQDLIRSIFSGSVMINVYAGILT